MTRRPLHAFDTNRPTARSSPCSPRRRSTFVRGRGTELWDVDGKRYLDFLGGLAVISLGHSNPVVTDAIAKQARDALARVQPVRQPGHEGETLGGMLGGCSQRVDVAALPRGRGDGSGSAADGS